MLLPIGVVRKVFFNKIVIEIDDMKKLNQNYKGDIYSCEGLDTFILLEKSYEEKLIYQISALYDEEKPLEKEDNSKFQVKAYFEAVPIGNIIKEKFEYGIERYPLLGDEVYLASKEELNKILGNDLEINENNFIIGELSNKKGYYPKINIDNFFTTHISILGNTGSGKSTTIKTIIKKLSEKIDKNFKKENVNFYIFDIHNEYTNISSELSNKISLEDEELEEFERIVENKNNLKNVIYDVKIKNIREIENERKKAELKAKTDELEKQLSENPASVFQIDTIGARKELERRRKKEQMLKFETKDGTKNVEVIEIQDKDLKNENKIKSNDNDTGTNKEY